MGLFPEWTWIVGLFIGAAIGSFLNVVIYRMPRGMSLSEPKHSFCPSCKTRLTIPDLFPLLSWLVLRGRCRHCRNPIPARYFFVELLNGGLWAALWYQHLIIGQDPLQFVGLALFISALVAAIYIDLRYFIIPDEVNAAMLVIGLLLGAAKWFQMGQPAPFLAAVAGAAVGVGALWGIAFLGRLLFGKDAMGHGDIKMARGIGAVLLPSAALMSFAAAVVLGAVLGIVQVLARRFTSAPSDPGDEDGDPMDEPPETIGSLLKCGVGYLFAVDVLGLLVPKVYQSWFGEDPYAVELAEEDPPVSWTMIPFGPYLAGGAIALALAEPWFRGLVAAYWRFATGGLG